MLVAARRSNGMGDLRDFVRARFPEPNNPIWRPGFDRDAGMGSLRDFVDAYFPEPMNPLFVDQPKGIRGIGCGGGCGCDSCGMGALSVPTWASQLPSPLNDSAAGVPVVYWIGGALAAVVVLPMIFKKGRR